MFDDPPSAFKIGGGPDTPLSQAIGWAMKLAGVDQVPQAFQTAQAVGQGDWTKAALGAGSLGLAAAPMILGMKGAGDMADLAQGIRAYHGSPYSFDQFDMSKVGSGEGAQAYGHGLYFAGNEDVAQAYRDQVKNGKMQPGSMYEASINAKPEHFLDWDKPLSAQSPAVQKAIGYVPGTPGSPSIDEVAATIRDARAAGVPLKDYAPYKALQEQHQKAQQTTYENLGIPNVPGIMPSDLQASAYHTGLVQKLGDPSAATSYLQNKGIPGIRYLDQGSRASGQGTNNYVVFDDKLINIIRKYGVGALIASGAIPAGQYVVPDQQQ